MKFRTIASLGLAASTALALTTVVSPAEAATATSISIHVQNIKAASLKNVEVSATKGTGENQAYVYLGRTNSNGNLSKASGVEASLTGGTWTFELFDVDSARFESRTNYAPKTFTATLTKGQNRDFGTRTLATGIRISGTVTAASGRVVRNAEVRAQIAREPGSTFVNGIRSTDAKGAYKFSGMSRDTYYMRAYTGSPTGQLSTFAKVIAGTAGASYTGNKITGVKVSCDTSFEVESGFNGGVVVTVKSDASYWGLDTPRGAVGVSQDGLPIGSVDLSDVSTTSRGFDASAGEHTYTASYTGGDCYDWNASQTVVVQGGSDF